MTINDARQQLDSFLVDVAPMVGYRRIGPLECASTLNEATALLSFPTRLSVHGVGLFNAWVGIRFDRLAQWLDGDDADRLRSTIARPIHLLRTNKSYVEWKFTNINDLESLRDEILGDLRNYALPFVQRYSHLRELRRAAESVDNRDWISAGLSVDSRVTVLAAIQVVEGDKAGALKTLDDALIERKGGHRKRRFEIEYLRTRLLSDN